MSEVETSEAEPVQEQRIFSVDDAIAHGNLVNENIISQWLPVWSRNAFAHHQYIDPVRQNLRTHFDLHLGATAVIVSTGPSLDRNLRELNEIPRDKFVLIATTSALNPLLANGLKPEYAAINDGQAWIADLHYDGLRDLLTDTTLLISTMTHPSTALEWPGRRLYYNDFGPDLPFIGAKGTLSMVYPELWNIPVSGCTTNLSIRAALLMGFSRMVLIGTDLAFSDRSAHGTKYDRVTGLKDHSFAVGMGAVFYRDGSAWTARPKADDFFKKKARWIMRLCPVGCEHVVQEWGPKQPLEPNDPRYEKCQYCGAKMRHCPTSAEYLFYYRNLMSIADPGSATLRNPATGKEEARAYEVINSTGDGIAVNIKNMPLRLVFP